MSAPHPLMTTAEVSAMFQVSAMTVHRWRHTGRLTAITLPGGKTIRYFRTEIQALADGKPLTPAQITGLRDTLLDGTP